MTTPHQHQRRAMTRVLLIIGVLLAAADPPGSVQAADNPAPTKAEELFAHRILPLMKEKCFVCHGDDPADVRGQLDMRSLQGLQRGGESGEPAVVPGEPELSPLYLAVSRAGDFYSPMPPKENDKLTGAQVEYVRAWIASGAPWPDDERLAKLIAETADRWNAADGVRVETSGGLSPEWTNRGYDPVNLWAYRPLARSFELNSNSAGEHPVDHFIERRLDEMGLAPAPPADRATLIRRVTLDLTGLPPTPAEIADFVGDADPDAQAFATVVDRLLASPHYGEQMARHWLDVVRYADSSGYANDYERGNAWRYRDYVIRAFNEDKPYDQFVVEQIAGDELVEARSQDDQSTAIVHSQDAELLVASGFLRMGPWELTGMEVAKIARQRFLDDVTDAVGQVFLGHMLQCARCHDHKFDPVPTRDYYAMQAMFATTQLAEREAPFMAEENTEGFEEKQYLQARRQYYQQILDELDRKSVAAAFTWYEENGIDPQPFRDAIEQVLAKNPQSDEQKNGDSVLPDVDYGQVRNILMRGETPESQIPPRHVGFAPEDFGMERVARKGIERLVWRQERYEPYALSVYSGRTPEMKSVNKPLRVPQDRMESGELETTCILTGGDPFSPAQEVEPGVLSAIVHFTAPSSDDTSVSRQVAPSDEDPPITGRRLALARWIASPENPLTARVIANRVWQWHFGQAIAGNPNNFGTTGKKPSHPELLDWLAVTLMEEGWSLKALHRRILHSDAYRRSAQHPEPTELAEKDPDGTSYAVFQPRRLTAEELRDAMLAVSGELNPAFGGIPVRPEMNLEAALQPRMVMGTFAEAWQPSPRPDQRHRRSIYVLRIRGQRDPFMEVFNAPTPDLSCEARDASTVTPQVFALFNSEITFARALAFADRLLAETDSREEAVQRAFQLAYGRQAAPAELQACLEHWSRMTKRHQQLQFAPPEYPDRVVREAVEENTGEKFAFVEPLEVYQDFVPDLLPATADARTRGLAEVCLVLLNANEFAYVY